MPSPCTLRPGLTFPDQEGAASVRSGWSQVLAVFGALAESWLGEPASCLQPRGRPGGHSCGCSANTMGGSAH